MKELCYRLVFFVIVSSAVAYCAFLVAGSVVFARAAGQYDPIIVRDVLSPGLHQLSAIVEVPSGCDELQDTISKISATLYQIAFTTWQEPSVSCDDTPTPRSFRDQLFAPSVGVQFVATMNGQSLPITVISAVAGQND